MGRRSVVRVLVALVTGVAVSCASAATDVQLLGFTVSNPLVSFDGTHLFKVTIDSDTVGHLYRNVPPQGNTLLGGTVGSVLWGGGDFSLSMEISDITGMTASGDGSFSFKDLDGTVLKGDVKGTWTKGGKDSTFAGSLSNVTCSGDSFDGFAVPSLGVSDHVSMIFDSPQPWGGTFMQLPGDGWFVLGESYSGLHGGSIDVKVSGGRTHAPVPGALILAVFGMVSTAGLRRRRSL